MLPKDPVMLLSVVNTKLRDEYASLEEFCAGMGVERPVLAETLQSIGYVYDEERNQFV